MKLAQLFRKSGAVPWQPGFALLPVIMIILCGITIYANSLTVPFVLDDFYTIEYMGKKGVLFHLEHGSARRIADATFAFNYGLNGLSVTGYHIVNLVIHLATALLVFYTMHSAVLALNSSFNNTVQSDSNHKGMVQYFPFLVALFFVLHPLQTQAVTYIIQRYTSLATFFYLLAVLLFLNGRIQVERGGSRFRLTLLFGGTLMAGLLAFGTKQIAVTLPLMLVAIEAFLFRGRLLNRYFAIACGVLFFLVCVIILYIWRNSSLADFLFDLRHATSEDLFFTRTSYFLTQLRVVATYIRLLVAPYGQSLVHESPIYTTLSLPVISYFVLHIAIWSLSARLFQISGRNFHNANGEVAILQRLASFGVVWFYWALAIESSIFPIRDIMFEHRVYLPSVGFFMLVVAALMLVARRLQFSVRTLWGIMILFLLTLGCLTIARNRVWNNSLLLWQESAAIAPNKWLTQANLAGEYLDCRMPEKALPHLIRALELNPGLFIRTKVFIGEAMKQLHLYEDRFTTGQEFIIPGGPAGSGELDYAYITRWDATINNNVALAYEYLNQPLKARQAYEVALTMDSGYDVVWYNFGLFCIHSGDLRQARIAFTQLNALHSRWAAQLGKELPK
jgi:tetratricopeptide (TPR) repeat protein